MPARYRRKSGCYEAACDASKRYWTRWRRREEQRRAQAERAEADELLDWERVDEALEFMHWTDTGLAGIAYHSTVVVSVPDVYGDEL